MISITRDKIPTLLSCIVGDAVIIFGIVIAFRYLPIPRNLQMLYAFATISTLILVLFVQWFVGLIVFASTFLLSRRGGIITPVNFYDGMMGEYRHPKNIIHIIVWAIGVFATTMVATIPSNGIAEVWVVAVTSLFSIWCVDFAVLQEFTLPVELP